MLRQYLELYAEPEARQLAAPLGRYSFGLGVPARGESVAFLEGYRAAASSVAGLGRTLVVVVANEIEPLALQSSWIHTLASKPDATWLRPDGLLLSRTWGDVLIVDRATSGRTFTAKQGAGLARKLAADVLLELHRRGHLEVPWLFSTDADATLPGDYFHAALHPTARDAAALLFPYRHVTGAPSPVARATELYELWLRYYQAGLYYAGSPYAFTALGSAMAIGVEPYASVRGYSQRLAGEDHYTLQKLAKVGILRAARAEPVELLARASTRAPFGTGPVVSELLARGGEPALPFLQPRGFELLRTALDALPEVARVRAMHPLRERLQAEAEGAEFWAACEHLDLPASLGRLLHQAKASSGVLRRLHEWLDGLKTLRLLHAFRDRAAPALAWREALVGAPFVPRAAVSGDVSAALAALRALAPPAELGTRRAGHP